MHTPTKSKNVLDPCSLGPLESTVNLISRHVGAGEVHHGLQTTVVLGCLTDLQGKLACAPSSTPSHINPDRIHECHALQTLIEVLNTINSLWREVLKGEAGLLCLYHLVDFIYDLHCEQRSQNTEEE